MAFAEEVLCKSCDDVGSERLGLVKTVLRALMIDMLRIKAWIRVLTLALFSFVSTISICLAKAYFSIFFHKSTVFEVMSEIILEYIVACGKALERSISG